ncbi:hypothetical protein HDU82_002484 [Entophlyctis luteolus]|nr:hypothetical protein HDU82_002484 [Entophlyctis luteolus]
MSPPLQPPAPPLGSAALRRLFPARPQLRVPANHGSFGRVPIHVLDARVARLRDIENDPDRFCKHDFHPALDAALLPVARLLGLDSVANLVFTVNATTAVNAVLRSLKAIVSKSATRKATECSSVQQKQKILFFSTLYGNLLNAINYTCENDGFTACCIQITTPITTDMLLRTVEKTIAEETSDGSEIVLAVYDVISSAPAVVVPYKELTSLFQKHKILTCVDGAHAIGQIPVNLAEFKPDFFVTNLHKWLFAPRGCCVFYVDARFHGTIRHPVISEVHVNNWRGGFHWVGTTDVSSYLTVPDALAFREWIGGESAIMSYNHTLAVAGGSILTKKLPGSQVLCGADESEDPHSYYASMVNVSIPDTPVVRRGGDAFMASLQVRLMLEHNVSVAFYKHAGKYWVRVSAQVYLCEQDFEALGDVLHHVFFEGCSKL